jgi:hypothetical protein
MPYVRTQAEASARYATHSKMGLDAPTRRVALSHLELHQSIRLLFSLFQCSSNKSILNSLPDSTAKAILQSLSMAETNTLLIARILGISSSLFLSGFAFSASYYTSAAISLSPIPLRLQQWQVVYDLGKIVSPPVSALSGLLGLQCLDGTQQRC